MHLRSCLRPIASLLVCGIGWTNGQTSQTDWNLEIPTAATDVVMHQRTIREPIVKVTDRNNKPIAAASVTFLIVPNGGAGASFPGGQLSLTVQTNEQGLAQGTGMMHNGVAGNYEVQVRAEYQGQVKEGKIRYRNLKPKPYAKYLLGAGAVALLVSLVVIRGGNPEISAGSGTVRP